MSRNCRREKQTRFNRLQALTSYDSLQLVVKGRSMDPAYRDGDRVTVHAKRWHWPGDVLAFVDRHGQLVLHRVIGFRLAGWSPIRVQTITKGDNSGERDAPLSREQILGRVEPISWSARLVHFRAMLRLGFQAIFNRARHASPLRRGWNLLGLSP